MRLVRRPRPRHFGISLDCPRAQERHLVEYCRIGVLRHGSSMSGSGDRLDGGHERGDLDMAVQKKRTGCQSGLAEYHLGCACQVETALFAIDWLTVNSAVTMHTLTKTD